MFILKCEAFDREDSSRHTNKCCNGDCHSLQRFIPVTPYAVDATLENRRLDWEIGIQAMVCCGRYEFVRSLPREWWVKKGVEVGLWDEAKARQLMHSGSWHPTYDSKRPASGYVKSTPRAGNKCPKCKQKWNGDVCENCGYSND